MNVKFAKLVEFDVDIAHKDTEEQERKGKIDEIRMNMDSLDKKQKDY